MTSFPELGRSWTALTKEKREEELDNCTIYFRCIGPQSKASAIHRRTNSWIKTAKSKPKKSKVKTLRKKSSKNKKRLNQKRKTTIPLVGKNQRTLSNVTSEVRDDIRWFKMNPHEESRDRKPSKRELKEFGSESVDIVVVKLPDGGFARLPSQLKNPVVLRLLC